MCAGCFSPLLTLTEKHFRCANNHSAHEVLTWRGPIVHMILGSAAGQRDVTERRTERRRREEKEKKALQVNSDLNKGRLHNLPGENEHSGGRPELQMGRV